MDGSLHGCAFLTGCPSAFRSAVVEGTVGAVYDRALLVDSDEDARSQTAPTVGTISNIKLKALSIELARPRRPGVIDVNHLHVGIEIQGRRSLLALADAGRLHA